MVSYLVTLIEMDERCSPSSHCRISSFPPLFIEGPLRVIESSGLEWTLDRDPWKEEKFSALLCLSHGVVRPTHPSPPAR